MITNFLNLKNKTTVLFAWQRMCKLLTKESEIADEVDVDKLRSNIPEIKKVMFMARESDSKKIIRNIF